MVLRPERAGKRGTHGPKLVGGPEAERQPQHQRSGAGGAGAISGQETNEQIKEGSLERIARILNAILMVFKRAREEQRRLSLLFDGWTGL